MVPVRLSYWYEFITVTSYDSATCLCIRLHDTLGRSQTTVSVTASVDSGSRTGSEFPIIYVIAVCKGFISYRYASCIPNLTQNIDTRPRSLSYLKPRSAFELLKTVFSCSMNPTTFDSIFVQFTPGRTKEV